MSTHIGWFGHDNIGDDEMLRILETHLPGVRTFGGGTLISPYSEFYEKLDKPEEIVGISLGVADSWSGQGFDVLKRLKRIYVRDYYSYHRLKTFDIESTLSVDLWYALVPDVVRTNLSQRTRSVINVLDLSHKNEYLSDLASRTMASCRDWEFFDMGDDRITGAFKPQNGKELLAYLSTAKRAIVTRLHALVAAKIAGVPDIRPIFYDAKCCNFLEHMNTIETDRAHEILMNHFEEIKKL